MTSENQTGLAPFERIFRESKAFVVLACAGLLVLVGLADYTTGWEISLRPFYLIPVSLAAWYLNRASAVFVAVVTGAVWFAADLMAGHAYSRLAVTCWNASVELVLFVIVALIVAALRRRVEQLVASSRTDELTGLPNRRAFFERADLEVSRGIRFQRPMTVAYLDADNFKLINDRGGHVAGDAFLRAVAAAIERCLRGTDLVARLGGDEFVVLLPETDVAAADIVLDKIRRELELAAEEFSDSATFSVGAVTFLRAPESVDQLIGATDDLMYRAKNAGRNRMERATV
jgi:diguanylate cyclase (GGDEF)-like protein